MAKANPYYLGLGYYESIESKKNILSSEMSLLNMIKIMRRYYALRTTELEVKSKMQKSMGDLNLTINKIKSFFPEVKSPEKTKKEEVKKKEAALAPKERFDADLEAQVKEIQERLKAIEG